jgi:two-component system capsular synthesis sensor histidine kinase RcsC
MLQTEIVRQTSPQPIPRSGRKRQVLVIDDDKTYREALSRMRVSLGYNVTLSTNGFDGGLLFCTRDYDLVIIHLKVPQMNVWELSRIFKEHSPKTPVVMATEFSGYRQWKPSDTNCVDAIIPTPLKLKEIEGILRRLLNSGS